MPKVTMLGAGSFFTPGLMRDVMLIPGFEKGEIRLVDIDAGRLGLTLEAVKAISRRLRGGGWKVTASTDRRKALPGADYVINCIEVSGVKTVRHDYAIPMQYGVDQCIGDTIGPGGIFKALRTVPAWLGILADIERLCPGALVMNYTNPMSIMTLAAVRSTSAQVVGLCHSVQGTSRQLADIAQVPYEEMAFRCAGVNHLAWFTELTHRGIDLYPKITRRAMTEKEVYEREPVRFEMMFHFGAFVTESSGHLSEYLPYWRKRKDLLKKYTRDGYGGGSGFYADMWPKSRANADRERRKLARDVTRMDLERGHEFASDIIEAHHYGKPAVVHGSVANRGLIENLPADGVVEVAVLVDRNGFNPCRFGRLPAQMAAICASNMAVYECAVSGILNEDRDAIYHAMMLDPLTAAVLSPPEIVEMADKLARAEKDYIPKFMTKGLGARRKPAGRR